jgi:hypothetical protein
MASSTLVTRSRRTRPLFRYSKAGRQTSLTMFSVRTIKRRNILTDVEVPDAHGQTMLSATTFAAENSTSVGDNTPQTRNYRNIRALAAIFAMSPLILSIPTAHACLTSELRGALQQQSRQIKHFAVVATSRCPADTPTGKHIQALVTADAATDAETAIASGSFRLKYNALPAHCGQRLNYTGARWCETSQSHATLEKALVLDAAALNLPAPSPKTADWCAEALIAIANRYVDRYNERVLSNTDGRRLNGCR